MLSLLLAKVSTPRPARTLRVVIVWAGFSGMAMALAMKRDGHADEIVIVDAAEDLGGTWRDNTYPGCACDVPSPVYSLRGQPNDWPRFFSEQPDILDYMHRVAAQHDLRRHMRFGTEIVRQEWDEARACWLLTTAAGETMEADVVVNGVGPLTRAVIPDIPGRDDFAGPAFHSAHWRDDVDLEGARVGIIGTGASAVQIVPSIVDEVGAMTVFQRTPGWVLPKLDREFSGLERLLLRRVPGAHRVLREVTNLILEHGVWRMLERNPRVAARLRSAGTWNIHRAVEDPELREKLTPTIEPGCKRLLLSNTYYPALARDHVTVATEGIERITPSGVRLVDGTEVALDVIIWGTGFDAHHFWAPMEVIGRDGQDLHDAWSSHAAAYNSLAAPGFPNNFFLLGPNSGTGHNSVVLMAEAQADYVAQALEHLRAGRADWLEPTQQAADAYAAEMAERHADLVWASGCGSWYLNEDGVNDTLYPGRVGHYQRRVSTFDPESWSFGRRRAARADAEPAIA